MTCVRCARFCAMHVQTDILPCEAIKDQQSQHHNTYIISTVNQSVQQQSVKPGPWKGALATRIELVVISETSKIIDYLPHALQESLPLCAPRITLQQPMGHILNLPRLTLPTPSLLPRQPSPSSTLNHKGGCPTSQHHHPPSQSLTSYIPAS